MSHKQADRELTLSIYLDSSVERDDLDSSVERK